VNPYTVLINRANLALGLLEQWAEYDKTREAEASLAGGGRRVRFVDEYRPHFGNQIAGYCAQVVAEHQRALEAGCGDAGRHSSAVQAWALAARAAKNDSGWGETARRLRTAFDLSQAIYKRGGR
jgi:hypothetical protein